MKFKILASSLTKLVASLNKKKSGLRMSRNSAVSAGPVITASLFLLSMVCAASACAQVLVGGQNRSLLPKVFESDFHTKVVAETYGKLPLAFEANEGQTDSRVRFLARGGGYTLFLSDDEAVLQLGAPHGQQADLVHEAVVRMRLLGASHRPAVSGMDELPGKANYFIGNDPQKWRTDVPNYRKVRYQGVYPGVDMVYYGNQGQLEYDLIVAPGTDPQTITFGIEAGTSPSGSGRERKRSRRQGTSTPLRIDSNGDLLVQLAGDQVRFRKPVVYQWASDSTAQTPAKEFIDGRFVLKGRNAIGFEIASYDRTRSLVIDPILAYSSYIGGSHEEQFFAIAVDSAGAAYVTGFTYSSDFPRVGQIPGACNGTCGNGTKEDTFITKISPAGDALVYSTYIGGSGSEYGNAIGVDGAGNAYLVGDSTSIDFPLVNQIPGICKGSCGHGSNYAIFFTKLNAAGNAIVYSSYMGGSSLQEGYGMTVDAAGNAYLTGFTTSADFPRINQIPGACVGSCGTGADFDMLVAKVNAAGSAVLYSSLIGGSREDRGLGMALDSSGNVYLTGKTISTDYPRVNQIPGACLGACGSGADYDAFVTKINAAGSAIVYSSYLGGSLEDFGYLAVDSSDNVYLTGYTESADFPRLNQIPGACQGTCGNGNGNSHAFATKINSAGDALVYSSLIGGSGNDEAFVIAVDGAGNAYLEGFTNSSNFPKVNQVAGACLGACGTGGNYDGFVTKVDAAGDALLYSTYLGGSADDNHGFFSGMTIDSAGNVYVGGETHSFDFPRVKQIAGACLGTCGTSASGGDAYVTKIAIAAAVNLSPASLDFGAQGLHRMNVPQVVTLTNVGDGVLLISSILITGANNGDFSETDNCSVSGIQPGDHCNITVVFSPQGSGTRNASVVISDNAPGSPQMIPLTGVGVGGKVSLE
jgi:hypothetical protein